MTTNEGVGKKIVEALKKQANPELELTEEYIENTEEKIMNLAKEEELNAISEGVDSLYDGQFVQEVEPQITKEEDKFEIKEQPVFQSSFHGEQVVSEPEQQITYEQPKTIAPEPQGWNFSQPQEFQSDFRPAQPEFTVSQPVNRPLGQAKQFDMPPNVAVLKKLITQLPTGVTKQTGAQIIKQTMEALGISMSTVLHEAQKVQDDMNESIKNCMVSIQEYKNNIKNLEKQGLDYQRQVNQLNDLISLFILSDKD